MITEEFGEKQKISLLSLVMIRGPDRFKRSLRQHEHEIFRLREVVRRLKDP